MPLALSICVLFNLLIQSVNGTQFLNTVSIPLFPLPSAKSVPAIILFTSIYASLLSHKLDFKVEVLNSVWLLALYVPSASSFTLS